MIDQIIEAARECKDTPFVHQGRMPGRALDCAGLVRYPALKLKIIEPDDDYLEYGREPVPEKMKQTLDKYLIPIRRIEKGCVLWFKIKKIPMHLAIYTGSGIIHAVSTGPKRVVEHSINSQWTDRITGIYRYKY